jgi:dipeptidyl aminopeptidase/acylaminoacyl peptidase
MPHLAEAHCWQNPPSPITEILDTPASPAVSISPNDRWLVEFWRPELMPIAKLAEPELGIAGFRINPTTRSSARNNPYRKLAIRELIHPNDTDQQSQHQMGQTMTSGRSETIELPDNAQMTNFKWSDSGDLLAFTMVKENGLELWVLNAETQQATQITPAILNATYGTPYRWLNQTELLCKVMDETQPNHPLAPAVPPGPIVQENLGTKIPTRTYVNLLKNTHDEALFDYYTRSALEIINLTGDRKRIWDPEIINEAIPSPDNQYILLSTVHKPYSYQLPSRYFPQLIQVITLTGESVYTVEEVPLIDRLSTKFDAVRTGRRHISWRSDHGASLYWIEALDEGDPKKEAPLRDRLSYLPAPFNAEPIVLWECAFRFKKVRWGNDNLALVTEQWYDDRHKRIWQINPAMPETPPKLIIDRSTEDHYNNPGSPCMTAGPYDWNVLQFTPDGEGIYYYGKGASEAGVHPFLAIRETVDLGNDDRVKKVWECKDPYYEGITRILKPDASELIISRQSKTEPANYFWFHKDKLTQITDYPDPSPQFAGIQKELVTYDRADGVQLSAKLYLPEGYEPDRDGPLPIIFWVYPEEFKDAKLAGQITSSHHSFSRPHFTSVLFLLTQGYAVLDNPSMPIVGEGEAEPNDSYVEQLISSATAAIDFVVSRGVGDRDRVGIGGHSYGAFTTANLLAHTNLFKLGIARSGAYNRTLTPFGFQGEQRDFWEAQNTYIHMSPFTHAAKIKSPLLLIHGAGDNNPGTYPMQTDRLFDALKGLGAMVRYVSLPLEDHGYRSREGVGHALWEMVRWCDLHLKGIDKNMDRSKNEH